jgi:tRNA 5-methylaminomethyl-2-thiouridine biosynthesis bifunctional protein
MGMSPPNSRRETPHTANKSHHPGLDSSRPAQATDAPAWQADLAKQRSALASAPLWHLQAGWVRPTQLVRALLSQPGIRWRGGCQVARAEAMAHPPQQAGEPGTSPATNPSTQHHRWQVFNESGVLLECCDLLVLAAGPATAQLLARWATPEQFPTHQVHGLVTVGDMAHWPKRPDWVDQPDRPGAPSHAQQPTDSPAHRAGSTPPVNGHGSLLCDIPGLQRSAAPAAGTGTAKIGTHSTDTHHAVGTGNTTGETTRKTTAASGASSANSETGANNANGESSASGANSANSHFWCTGASFLRSLPRGFDAATIAAEHQANALRLAELLPVTAAAVRQQIRAGQVWHWHGTRCTVADRVPLVGPLLGLHGLQAGADRKAQPVGKHTPSGATRPQTSAPAPWVCTALGARGMTLGVLCGELLAAWVHGEPLPLASSLAAKLQASRFMADGHTAA